jgi:hypothetical protein
MGKLGEMYRSQHSGALLKYEDVVLVFTAYTLEQTGRPDVVNYSFKFSTLDKEIYCHSIALSQGPRNIDSFKQSTITLSGPDGKLITTDYLPILDPKTPEKREILLLFDRVLPAGSGPYALRIQDTVQGLMSDLLEKKRDVLFAKTQRTATPIGRIRTILHIPGSFSNALMRSPMELAGHQVEGRAMTPQELIDFSPPAPGWLTMGWQGENVYPKEFFGPSVTI